MRETKFKKTDIGLIPENWRDIALKDVGFFLRGTVNPSCQPRKLFYEYSMPAFDRLQRPNFVEGITMHSSRTPITGEVLLINKLNVRQKRIWHVNNASEGSVCSGEFLPFSSSFIDLCYLKHVLLTDKVVNEWNDNSTGTSNSQKRITPNYVLQYRIPFPPLDEQRKIAKALSDIDGLIDSLTKLIDKQKDIKIGTMQQLLNGEKRLAGFSEEWEEHEIGEVVKIVKGQSLQSKDFINGSVPVVAGGQSYAGYHNVANHTDICVTISASGAYAGYVWLHDYPIFASDCSVIEGNEDMNIRFLYYVLKLNQDVIYKAQTGGAQPHIHPRDISPIKLSIPSIDEQAAIATVLTDMDTEIASLEAKKEKFELIKKGMMQELLTGRVRLV